MFNNIKYVKYNIYMRIYRKSDREYIKQIHPCVYLYTNTHTPLLITACQVLNIQSLHKCRHMKTRLRSDNTAQEDENVKYKITNSAFQNVNYMKTEGVSY